MASRLLLVDDDANMLDTAKDILEDAGYEVTLAPSVSEALSALGSTTFGAMITDLNLPDGTGLVLAEQARAKLPSLFIILMTGESENSQPAGLSARQNGIVDDYLVKPVSPQQLLNILSRALG